MIFGRGFGIGVCVAQMCRRSIWAPISRKDRNHSIRSLEETHQAHLPHLALNENRGHRLRKSVSVRHDQAPAVPSALFTGSLDLSYVPEGPSSQKFDPAD
jgi:hypothetical protein